MKYFRWADIKNKRKAMETKIGEADGEDIVTGPLGGAGSKIPWYELVDARALEEIASVFTHGAKKYQLNNWRAVPVEEHLRHLVRHAFRFLEWGQQYYDKEPGFREEQHEELSHLACRAVMALAVWLQDPEVAGRVPKGLAEPIKEKNKGLTGGGDTAWFSRYIGPSFVPLKSTREGIPLDPSPSPAETQAKRDFVGRKVPKYCQEDDWPSDEEPAVGPVEETEDGKARFSLYDFGVFEMSRADYESRRSSGIWNDKDKARQAIDGMVRNLWARRVG